MIETRDLTKMYGDLYALNRLTLKLEKGDVYGFIGPNGSGKTTTMRILATLLQPTWGEATVCGYSIYNNAKEIRRAIGFMPDFYGVYDDMKVIEYLEFFAAAYRIKGPGRRAKCEQVLQVAVQSEATSRARDHLEMHPDVTKVELNTETYVLRVTLKDGVADGSAIATSLVNSGFALRMLKEEEINLEHVFIGITKGL